MVKKIYMNIPSSYVNQHFANLIINEELPVQDKNDLRKFKKMYETSKAWLFLESDFPLPELDRKSRYKDNWQTVTSFDVSILFLDQSFIKKHLSKIFFL